MKRQKVTLEERANWCERVLCDMFEITNDEFLNIMYETGCAFAEKHVSRLPENQQSASLIKWYITSQVYWYYWMREWITTCEVFIDWDYTHKSFDHFIDMQMQAKRPWPILHEKIVQEKSEVERVQNNRHGIIQ